MSDSSVQENKLLNINQLIINEDIDTALRILEESSKTFDSQSYTFYLLGFCLLKKSNFSEAYKNFLKLKEFYDSPEINFLILFSLFKLEAYDEVIHFYLTNKKGLLTVDARILLAQSYYKLKLFKFSKKIYEEIMVEQPNCIYALNNLLCLEEDYSKITEYVRRIKEIDPNHIEANCNAAILMLKHNIIQGKDILEEYIDRKVIPIPTFHFYISYLLENREVQVAESLLKKFIQYTPNDNIAWLCLFNIYISNNNPEAIPLAEKILAVERQLVIRNFVAEKVEAIKKKIEKVKENICFEPVSKANENIDERTNLIIETNIEKGDVIKEDGLVLEHSITNGEKEIFINNGKPNPSSNSSMIKLKNDGFLVELESEKSKEPFIQNEEADLGLIIENKSQNINLPNIENEIKIENELKTDQVNNEDQVSFKNGPVEEPYNNDQANNKNLDGNNNIINENCIADTHLENGMMNQQIDLIEESKQENVIENNHVTNQEVTNIIENTDHVQNIENKDNEENLQIANKPQDVEVLNNNNNQEVLPQKEEIKLKTIGSKNICIENDLPNEFSNNDMNVNNPEHFQKEEANLNYINNDNANNEEKTVNPNIIEINQDNKGTTDNLNLETENKIHYVNDQPIVGNINNIDGNSHSETINNGGINLESNSPDIIPSTNVTPNIIDQASEIKIEESKHENQEANDIHNLEEINQNSNAISENQNNVIIENKEHLEVNPEKEEIQVPMDNNNQEKPMNNNEVKVVETQEVSINTPIVQDLNTNQMNLDLHAKEVNPINNEHNLNENNINNETPIIKIPEESTTKEQEIIMDPKTDNGGNTKEELKENEIMQYSFKNNENILNGISDHNLNKEMIEDSTLIAEIKKQSTFKKQTTEEMKTQEKTTNNQESNKLVQEENISNEDKSKIVVESSVPEVMHADNNTENKEFEK